MKNKLYRILAVAILLLASACDDPDPIMPTDNTIEGYWELDEILEDGDEIDFDEFNEDLKGIYYFFDGNGDFQEAVDLGVPTIEEGEWELDGKLLTLEFFNGDDVEYEIVSFSDDEITIREEDDDEYQFVYKKMDEEDFPEALVDPSDPDALSDVLVVPGTKSQGALPPPSNTQLSPAITNSQSSASITPDNTLYVPFTFTSTSGYGGVYIKVQGASSYWKIASSAHPVDGQVIIPVEIPLNVLTGDFCMEFLIYDVNNEFSVTATICVSITEPVDCTGSYYLSGSDGITITTINFGNTSGLVSLEYDMFSYPDRIDIFYDGEWVTGTGSPIPSGQAPPASECFDGTDGFVPDIGTLEFQYAPTNDGPQAVTVYTSGCYGGTSWNYTISCPN